MRIGFFPGCRFLLAVTQLSQNAFYSSLMDRERELGNYVECFLEILYALLDHTALARAVTWSCWDAGEPVKIGLSMC